MMIVVTFLLSGVSSRSRSCSREEDTAFNSGLIKGSPYTSVECFSHCMVFTIKETGNPNEERLSTRLNDKESLLFLSTSLI